MLIYIEKKIPNQPPEKEYGNKEYKRYLINHPKNNQEKFIEKRANVKVSVTFRGRELGNTSFGKTLLDTIIKETEDIASVLVEPKFENRTYSALLTPKKVK